MWSLRAPSLRAHQGVVTSFILVLLALPGPHGLLPSRRLRRVIEFLKQFVLKAKATQLWLPLARSQSLSHSLSLPVLCSQGLVLVLIKAVSFCVLPAFFHSLLWAERKQPHGGKRNEEVTKSRVWKEQVLCYSAIQPVGGGKHATCLQRPDAWNRVIIWRSMVPASLAIIPPLRPACSFYCCSHPAGAFGLKGSWEANQSACCLGVNQGRSQ